MKHVKPGWLVVIFIICFSSSYAQFSSNLGGEVTDPSGAAVPGAKVQLTNLSTQVSQTLTTDTGGNYAFSSLAPGHYQVLVQAEGFNRSSVTVTLRTGQTFDLPVNLTLAGTKQSIEVSSQAPALDTADSRLHMTLGNRELHTLPLQGENFLGLTALAPGVEGLGVIVGTNPSANSSGLPSTIPDNFATELSVDASANGRSLLSNMFVVDGLDITSDITGGTANLSPNPDSIQEYSVQTNDFSVEYGRASSIVSVVTTKSGTDQFHGSASDNFTDQYLWARTEFTAGSYAPFQSNNFSGTIGGPIVPIHHAYFFFAIEPLLSSFSTGNQAYTFEAPQFVQWAGQNFPNTLGTKLLTQYPISGATVTSVAETAHDIFPTTCGTAATANIPCSLPMVDSGTYEASPYRNGLQYNTRIDKYFSKDRLYGNFYRMTHDDQSPSIRAQMGTTNHYDTNSLQVNETHTFSPDTLNEAMFGFLRVQGINAQSGPFSVPVVSVVGQSTGIGVGFADGDFIQHNYRWRDVLTKVRGRHTFKFGYEGWNGNDLALFAPVFSQPNFVFTNLLNLVQDSPYSETSLAYDPLTGQPSKGQYQYAATTQGAFAQDTWKAKRNLTLTLGLRWDNFGNPYPLAGTVLSNFFLGSGNTMAKQVASGVMKQTSSVFNNSIKAFSPRVGLAWDPTGKGVWVVRGGFGIYHDWPTLGMDENNLKGNPPGWILPTFLTGTTTAPIFAAGTSNTYPYGFPYPPLPPTRLDQQGGLAGEQLSVGGINPNLGPERTMNYYAGIERQLPGRLLLGVSYSGSHSVNLLTGSELNQGPGTDVNRFAGDLIVNKDVLTRLNHSFGSIQYTQNFNTATYNALIVSVERHAGKRALFSASYTRSSSWDDGQLYPSQNNIAQYWQPSAFEAPNRVSFSGSYQVPTPGRFQNRVARGLAGGWGVSSTMILQDGLPYTVYTTAPFQPIFGASGNVIGMQPGSGDYNADGYNYDFPNLASFGYKTSQSRQAYLSGLYSASDFPVPALGTEGNLLPDRYRGPGFADVDLGLIKDNHITERVDLQLSFDFFNILNHPNLNGVDSNLSDATFGRSITVFNPRWIQMGIKLVF